MSKVFILYLILVLHFIGLLFRWYWLIPNYDTVLHFLGGFWVAMMIKYLMEKYFKKSFFNNNFLKHILLIIGLTMVIGLGWEGYEFLADKFIFHKNITQESRADTMIDLSADFFGALVYVFFSFQGFLRKNNY